MTTTQYGDELADTLTARYDSSPCADRGQNVVAFKYSAGGGARSMPAYDDGTTPTLVTEKPPACVLKVRGSSDTYIKRDGAVGTAGKGALTSDEVSFTVAATQDQTLFQPVDFRSGSVGGEGDATGTLQAKPNGGYSLNFMPGVTNGYIVRRLTPRECERLQGMPDDHTRIPYRGKPAEECPDGPRYKAIGNSMAVPVMRWLGERIEMVDREIGGDMKQNFRKAREAACIKAERAAVELDVSITTLFNWERGDTAPDAYKLRDMAQLYGVSTDYLLGL